MFFTRLVLTALLASDDVVALNEKALRLLEQKEFDQAIELLERAHESLPADATVARNLAVAHNNRGLKLLDAFEFGKAIHDFETAYKLREDEPLFAVHLGYAHLKRYDFARAEAVLEATRRQFPKEPKVYDYLGFLYYSDDVLDKAVDLWEQRLALADDAWARDMLGKAKREREVSQDFIDKTSNDFVLKLVGSDKNRQAADEILAWLEAARERVGSDLSYFPQRRTTVLLYTTEDFRKATGAHGWVGGLYDGKIRLQVRDFDRQKKMLRETIFHEYTHRVLAELAPELPIWLNEGLAEWYGNGGERAHDEILRLAKAGQTAPNFAALPETFARETDAGKVHLNYAASYSFTAFLLERYGLASIREILFALRRGDSVDRAMQTTLGGPLSEFEALWRKEVLREGL